MKKRIGLVTLGIGLLLGAQFAQAAFSDVSTGHPYYDSISYLQENGIVEGYEDGSYKPDQTVNRAEALKIILLGSDILVPEIADQDIFPDVLHGTWYAKFASKAKNLGIVSGDDDTGMFRPGDTVNLAEILKILLETNNVTLNSPETNPYPDVPTDAWFAPYFNYARDLSLLPQSTDEDAEPALPVTRGLMAELMYQLAMKPEGYTEGEASYYGEKFHGRTTASGEVFDASGLTAAHREFPFGTWVKVQNLENGETVTVRINDRGPYAGDRIIDLSKAAFEAISPLSRGVIQVSITPVSGPSASNDNNEQQLAANCPNLDSLEYAAADSFENISLNDDFPRLFLASEVFRFSGNSASAKEEVTAFVVDETEKQFPFYAVRDDEGDFEVDVHFPGPGDYQLGLLPGQSGSSIVEEITVIEENCLASNTDASLAKLSNLDLDIEEGEFTMKWDDAENYALSKVTFRQNDREASYIVYNEDSLTPYYPDFEGWDKSSVTVDVQGAHLLSDSIFEAGYLAWSPAISANFTAAQHENYIVEEDDVIVLQMPRTLKAGSSRKIKIDPRVSIDVAGLVILPNGFVEEIEVTSSTHNPVLNSDGLSVIPSTASNAELTFTPSSNALHFAEINDEEGQAVVNVPIYPEGHYPLIPNPTDLQGLVQEDLGNDLNALQNQMLSLVNQDRAIHGLGALTLDSKMNELAQFKAEDMAERDYFSHWTPEGITTNELRKNYAIAQFVSENIARDSNVELAQYGLMRSASHRANILDTEWKRAGFGIASDGPNGYLFVQVFSDDPIDFANVTELRSEITSALNAERSLDIALDPTLNGLAQVWSERMVSKDFFDFVDPEDSTAFVDTVRDAGVDDTLGTYILGNSSFETSVDQIAENAQIQDTRWKKLGIGIKQDQFGIIKITLVYTE